MENLAKTEKYSNMYLSHLLARLGLSDEAIKKYLNNENMNLISAVFDDPNGDEGGAFNPLKFGDLSLKDKATVLKQLLLIFNTTQDSKQKKQLDEIIDFIKADLENIKEREKEVPEKDKSADAEEKPVSSSRAEENYNSAQSRHKRYAEFALKKAKDPSFTATKEPHKTPHFGNYSREELIDLYRPEKFYGLSDKERHELFQATVNEYLVANGVDPCAVDLSSLPLTQNSICYGEYVPAEGRILLNSRLFDQFENMRNEGNSYFPYQILSTLIHEAQHRVQFSNIDKLDETNAVDYALKDSLLSGQGGLSYSSYLALADELDARNAALSYMKAAALSSSKAGDKLAAFYNNLLTSEQKNRKDEVSSLLKNQYQEIYSGEKINIPPTKQKAMAYESDEMRNILYGKYSSKILQKPSYKY